MFGGNAGAWALGYNPSIPLWFSLNHPYVNQKRGRRMAVIACVGHWLNGLRPLRLWPRSSSSRLELWRVNG